MYKNKSISQSGLSLIELMITVALMGILVVVLSQSLLSTIRSNMKAEVQKELKENGDYALDYIGRNIRNARSVAIGGLECSQGAVVPAGSVLTVTSLTNIDSIIECAVSPSSRIVVDGNPITSDGVEIASCSISCSSVAGAPGTIGISFVMKQAGSSPDAYETASQTFESTFTLRNK